MPAKPALITQPQSVHRAVEGRDDPGGTPRSLSTPTRTPTVHPACINKPGRSAEGYEELCHLVRDEDPDTALCGADVTGFPWNPPWPRCEACLAVARGQLN